MIIRVISYNFTGRTFPLTIMTGGAAGGGHPLECTSRRLYDCRVEAICTVRQRFIGGFRRVTTRVSR